MRPRITTYDRDMKHEEELIMRDTNMASGRQCQASSEPGLKNHPGRPTIHAINLLQPSSKTR